MSWSKKMGNNSGGVSSLSELTDVDLTNKQTGYGLIYDAITGKLVLQPLPSGGGSSSGLTYLPSPPSSGSYTAPYTIFNSTPTSGGSVGWVLTTSGIACDQVWQANALYSLGDRVFAKGYVYENQNDGHSAASAPYFPTTVGSTVNDNVTGNLTTWATGKTYNVGDTVKPTAYNGCYYKCTTASGVASNKQPTWPKTDSSTITDDVGNVWTAVVFANWKNIGVQAVFKEFGLISE